MLTTSVKGMGKEGCQHRWGRELVQMLTTAVKGMGKEGCQHRWGRELVQMLTTAVKGMGKEGCQHRWGRELVQMVTTAVNGMGKGPCRCPQSSIIVSLLIFNLYIRQSVYAWVGVWLPVPGVVYRAHITSPSNPSEVRCTMACITPSIELTKCWSVMKTG